MKTTIIALSILLAALVFAGCETSKPEPTQNDAASTGSSETQHAPAGVQPGSHEDWCGEHQVPETQCTQCNASLIPAFKATGDWCEEHGLPESHCRTCNPDLKIERPPKKGA